MNIFVLDRDPKKASQYHFDKHVVKMLLETAQLLCSAHHLTGTDPARIPYKLSHKNHPCAIWTRESLSNYFWLVDLGQELAKEYTHRYKKIHKSSLVINWCLDNFPDIPDKGLTRFALAMPDKYHNEDPVRSYRDYYLGEKSHLFKWTNREIPWWIVEELS